VIADLVVAELVAVVAELAAAPLDLAALAAMVARAGGGRRARHQRPARAEVLVVVAELAAVAMRWSPIASLVAALGSPTMASAAEELEPHRVTTRPRPGSEATAATSTRPGAVVTSSAAIAAAALAVAARLEARGSVLAGDVAQALGQLAEGGSNLDPLGGAGAAVALAGRRARGPGARPRGLAGDVAQELLAERCRRWRWSAPTTSMPSWMSLATSARPGAWRWS